IRLYDSTGMSRIRLLLAISAFASCSCNSEFHHIEDGSLDLLQMVHTDDRATTSLKTDTIHNENFEIKRPTTSNIMKIQPGSNIRREASPLQVRQSPSRDRCFFTRLYNTLKLLALIPFLLVIACSFARELLIR
ncbi:hypothetical protein PMAYCL1PPCAC_17091, partial [Pristionchus mayeri]